MEDRLFNFEYRLDPADVEHRNFDGRIPYMRIEEAADRHYDLFLEIGYDCQTESSWSPKASYVYVSAAEAEEVALTILAQLADRGLLSFSYTPQPTTTIEEAV